MSRILRRPMFRKGGDVGEGIMTGIVDRSNYANGTVPELGELTEQNIQALLKAAGPSQESDPLTTFLLQYGPALAQQRGGSTLGNIVAAAEKPIASMLESKRRESDFSRGLKIQAAGSAIKQRSEMESAERDILFKQELADKAADLQRDLSQAEIVAAKERADAQYLQNLELQSKKAADEYKMRSNLLREADLLGKLTTSEKIQEYTPTFAEEYDNDFTKGLRRATFEFEIRDQIVENFGESKVGGHINIDISNEKAKNKVAKRKIEAGGANKIYYNVNDNKSYLLNEKGLTPVDITKKEEIIEVIEQPGMEETTVTTPKSDFGYFSEEQKRKIKELQEGVKETPFAGSGA
jgi:oxalate decarboxylase/phosphoglucose isomerase-like protein (cupin superfamily)